MFNFDLQRFGGKGGGVSYLPAQEKEQSTEQKQLMQQQYDFTDKLKNPMFNLVDMGYDALSGSNFDPTPDYNKMYRTAMGNQAQSQQGYNNVLDATAQLSQGQLPQAFIDNKQKVIGNAVNSTLGTALNTGAKKGVINSSISDAAASKTGTWAADSMNKSFNSDISTVGGLYQGLGQGYQTQMENALTPMRTTSQAQDASLSYPGKMFQMAIGTYQPGADLFKTSEASRLAMSTPGQYMYQQPDNSAASAIGQIGGAYAACFPAGTMILSSQDEQIPIENITEGDCITTLKNKALSKDYVMLVKRDVQRIINLVHEFGELRCSPTQGLFTDYGIVEADCIERGDQLVTIEGLSEVLEIHNESPEIVYDLQTRDIHTVIADGVLAEVW